MDYTWNHGKWITTDPGPYDLVAKDSNGDTLSLRRLCSTEAAEMLGVWMAPNLSPSTLVTKLRNKATAWGAKIGKSNASHYEAWVALHTNMSARLKYPL